MSDTYRPIKLVYFVVDNGEEMPCNFGLKLLSGDIVCAGCGEIFDEEFQRENSIKVIREFGTEQDLLYLCGELNKEAKEKEKRE